MSAKVIKKSEEPLHTSLKKAFPRKEKTDSLPEETLLGRSGLALSREMRDYSCSFVSSVTPFGVMSPSMKRRIISVLALVRSVMDFLKWPGYLPAPL